MARLRWQDVPEHEFPTRIITTPFGRKSVVSYGGTFWRVTEIVKVRHPNGITYLGYCLASLTTVPTARLRVTGDKASQVRGLSALEQLALQDWNAS